MVTKSVRISEKGCIALDKIASFNPEKTRTQVLEEALVAQAKLYKGKPPKKTTETKASKKPAKKMGTAVKKPAKGR